MKYVKMTMISMLLVGMALLAFAESAEKDARIRSVDGKAQVKIAQEGKWVPAEVGMILHRGDVVKTGKDSHVVLDIDRTAEIATVEVKEDSQLMLAELIKDDAKGTQETLLDLAIGEVLIQAKKLHSAESKFEVKTPTSIVGVRGTKFSVKVEAVE